MIANSYIAIRITNIPCNWPAGPEAEGPYFKSRYTSLYVLSRTHYYYKGPVTKKLIGPLTKSVRPDQFWQPKLVPPCQFRSPCENVNCKQSKAAN